MNIGLAQINPTIGDFDWNLAKIKQFMNQAQAEGVDLLVFPELTITGYPPQDLLFNPTFLQKNNETLQSLVRYCPKEMALVIGFVDHDTQHGGKPLYNSAAVIYKNSIIHTQAKTLLPTYDVFDEARYFAPAVHHQVVTIQGVKIAITICEDIWNEFEPHAHYHEKPLERLAPHADILINISASPFYMGKESLREKIVNDVAARYQLPVAYCNMVGGNDSLIFDGNSLIANSRGDIIRRGKSFEEDLVIWRMKDRSLPISQPGVNARQSLLDALALGVRDYVQKCGFQKVVLGLSGGIDSAVSAAIAVYALGPDNVIGVLMPSRFSSTGSVRDAKQLARNLGIQTLNLPIHTVHDAFLSTLQAVFRNLPMDITEENLQARIRGALLMALSNKFGYLVLSTGNKSELSVGYCTLYGDMCGGIGVIADLPKMKVYELATYLNTDGERIPLSSIEKAPSAELRENQSDQDSLPPYPIVDQVVYEYIERERSLDDLLGIGIDPTAAVHLVKLIHQNEYKRRQSATVLKVTPKAFGGGRRFPIAHRFKEGR